MNKNGGGERENTARREEIPDAAPQAGNPAGLSVPAGCVDIVRDEDRCHGLCLDGETEKGQAGISRVSRCPVLHPGGCDVFPDICRHCGRWHPFRTGAMMAMTFP